MTPETALQLVIRPTLDFMGGKYASRSAQKMLIAIGLQESEFEHRIQVRGPAHGYWQFEKGGGVSGVLQHRSSKNLAAHLCQELDYKATADVVYGAIPNDSLLACIFARLLLYTDAKPLPDAEGEAWSYYFRNWRPGKPHAAKWPANWARAELVLNTIV